MARVNVEQKALSDPRYAVLGNLLGTSRHDALGRMIFVWNECQERPWRCRSASLGGAVSTKLVPLSRLETQLATIRTADQAAKFITYVEAARYVAKRAGADTPKINRITCVKIQTERVLADLVDAGQRKGEIAVQGKPSERECLTTLGDLGVDSGRLAEARLIRDHFSDKDLLDLRDEADEDDRDLTRTHILSLARRSRAEAGHSTRTPKTPKGKFRCLVVDPPWPMQKIERDVRPNQPRPLDYPTMTVEQIAEFKIPRQKAAPDCHLYLWTTHRFLPDALEIAAAWGFKYQCMMTWVKNVGITPFSWMYSTEHVLFCRKGNLKLLRNGLRLDFNAKVRGHSVKPDEFYSLVNQASPAKRLDVFSRREIEGFEAYGNE